MAKPLQEELQREIEATWGGPIPPRDDPSYAEMVRVLRERRPDLLEVLYALEEVPREQEVQMRAREGSQRIQKALLMEEDENRRPFLSKEKAYNLLIIGVAALVFIVVGTFLYGILRRGAVSPAPFPTQEASAPAEPQSPSPPAPSPLPPLPSPPPQPSSQTQGVAEESLPELPPPPSLDPSALPELSLPAPSVQTAPAPQPLAALAATPSPSEGGGGGLASFPSVQAPPQGAAQVEAAPSQVGGAVFPSQASQGLALLGREKSQQEEAVQEEPPTSEPPAEVSRPVPPSTSSPSSISPPPSFLPGLYKARVLVEPVLVEGGAAPLVLEGEASGRRVLFLGRWEVQAPGLVRGTVDRVLIGEMALAGRGQTYSERTGTAIPARVEDLAPALATDLVRAAVSGAARYVQDLREATRVVIGGQGLVAVERQAPPLLEQVVGGAASLFQPPQGGALVRVYRVPKGTEVGVLWEP